MGEGLSVVVASFSGEAMLFRCLDSLRSPRVAERVVATGAEDAALERLAARFPGVLLVRAPRDSSVFGLRARGLAAASGRFVALTEDHCTASPRWAETIEAALAAGYAGVGGPVEPGLTERTYHVALHLCEYGAHLPPLPEARTPILSGVNVAYDRGALETCRSVWQEAFYENEVHDALRETGHELYRVEAVMTAHLALPLGAAIRHLYRGGLRFGRYRRGRSPALVRAALPLLAAAVPGLLLARLGRSVALRRSALLPALLRGLPYVLCLIGAWSAGEAAGYAAPAAAARAEAPALRGRT